VYSLPHNFQKNFKKKFSTKKFFQKKLKNFVKTVDKGILLCYISVSNAEKAGQNL